MTGQDSPHHIGAVRDARGDITAALFGQVSPPPKLPEPERTAGYLAAVSAVTEAILNCFTREGGEWRPLPAAAVPELAEAGDTFVAVVPFPEERSALLAGIRYLSPTHRHRFRTPVKIAMAGGTPWAVSLDTMMSMLADDLGDTHLGDELTAAGMRGPDPTFLLSRIRQSIKAVALFLDARRDEVDALWSPDPRTFIASEQAGLIGHMAHPTTKSRWGMTPEQVAAYAPESGMGFALRWLAVEPALVEQSSATGESAAAEVERLLREDPAVDVAALDAALEGLGQRVLLPVHPWELEHLRGDETVARLLAEELIVDLGELGGAVSPTASMRTVWRGDWPWQLTFALHAHMTDEMRLPPLDELARAVDVAHELAADDAAARLAPDLTLLQDPAYLAVVSDGVPVAGLTVQLRENRWDAASTADVSSIEALLQDHPFGGESRIAQIVRRLAEESGRAPAEVAREWFARYAELAIVPLLRLRDGLGVDVESDQQSTLLELDGGWPAHVVLREAHGALQGKAAHGNATATSPGLGEGPFLDNAVAIINALGVAGIVEEIVLLGDLKALLRRELEAGHGEAARALLARQLDDHTWPCLAMMRTRLHNDVHRYVQIPNPLHGVRDEA